MLPASAASAGPPILYGRIRPMAGARTPPSRGVLHGGRQGDRGHGKGKRKPPKLGVCLVCTQLLRSLLVRDKLVAIMPLLIVWEHRGDTIAQGQVLPGDVESLPVLAEPGCADAGP